MNGTWIITGSSGQLGGHVLRAVLDAGISPERVVALNGRAAGGCPPGVREAQVDLATFDVAGELARNVRPLTIIHTAAVTAVGDAFRDPDYARQINVAVTERLADVADRMVFTSTDMVFDGEQAPYAESADPRPLSVYGQTKRAAELRLLARPHCLVVRLPLMYGFPVTPRPTTFVQQVAALRNRRPLKLFTDEFRTPVWLVDAARALVGLAASDRTGLLHVAGPERLSRLQLVQRAAALLGLEEPLVEAVSRLSVAAAEPRPADLSLDDRVFRAAFPELACGPPRSEVFAGAAVSDTLSGTDG